MMKPTGKNNKGFIISSSGSPDAVIVIAKNAPAPVRFAAQELKYFLDRMTGNDFDIVNKKPVKGRSIILGDCPWSRTAGIDPDSVERDGYIIHISSKTVFIAGKDDESKKSKILFTFNAIRDEEFIPAVWDFERGTLYGVYWFLEHLGIRWFFPGTKGMVVPGRKDITVKPRKFTDEPHFALRCVLPNMWTKPKDLPSKNQALFPQVLFPSEYKDLAWSDKEYRLWLLRMRASSMWMAFNHRPNRHFWEKRFGKSHPEYFAISKNGKRDLKQHSPRREFSGHLCYSEKGVFEETIKDIEAYFSGKPVQSRIPFISTLHNKYNKGWSPYGAYGDTFTLLPHDSYHLAACHCKKCRSLTDDKASFESRHSKLIWNFVARVGKEIEKKFPEKKLTCLAYLTFTEIPEGLKKLPDNIIVGICPYKTCEIYNLIKHEEYNKYLNLVKRWHRMISNSLIYYIHYLPRMLGVLGGTSQAGIPSYMPHFLSKYFRDIAKYGKYVFIEEDRDGIILEHLNRYIIYKLLWNPELDIDVLIDDYLQNFYGPAATYIGKILKSIESQYVQMNLEKTDPFPIQSDIYEKYFTESLTAEYRSLADKAIKLTKGTRYEDATVLFSRYFVGALEKGRRMFLNKVQKRAK
ncbi:DUF4838 domain-containing protein [bacterium]|nr:DUF4838 domain-containing protein [bacterium]